jgi:hypothetical protein
MSMQDNAGLWRQENMVDHLQHVTFEFCHEGYVVQNLQMSCHTINDDGGFGRSRSDWTFEQYMYKTMLESEIWEYQTVHVMDGP